MGKFKTVKICVLDRNCVTHLGLPLMCRPDDSGERDANALLVPIVPNHEWVCVPKRKPSNAKRKGTRKESSK